MHGMTGDKKEDGEDEDIAAQLGVGSLAADVELDALKDAAEGEIVGMHNLLGRYAPLLAALCHNRCRLLLACCLLHCFGLVPALDDAWGVCCCSVLTAVVLRSVCRQQCTESCPGQSSHPCPHLFGVLSAPSVAVVTYCLKSTSLVWPSAASSADDTLEDRTPVLQGLVAKQS